MKKKHNGFVNVLLIIAIAALVGAGVYAYDHLKPAEPTPGAVVYTTQLTDTINDFRNQANSSTANLNAELESVSGTIHGYGNIVNQNIPLSQSAGGTGTSTLPSDGQFYSANNSTGTWKNLIFAAGLHSTSTATSVTVGTQGFDPTQNFAFSGNNTHSGSETFNGTTTFAGTTTLSGTQNFTGPVQQNGTAVSFATKVSSTTNQSISATTTATSVLLPTGTTGTKYLIDAAYSQTAGNGGDWYLVASTTSQTFTLISCHTTFSETGYITGSMISLAGGGTELSLVGFDASHGTSTACSSVQATGTAYWPFNLSTTTWLNFRVGFPASVQATTTLNVVAF